MRQISVPQACKRYCGDRHGERDAPGTYLPRQDPESHMWMKDRRELTNVQRQQKTPNQYNSPGSTSRPDKPESSMLHSPYYYYMRLLSRWQNVDPLCRPILQLKQDTAEPVFFRARLSFCRCCRVILTPPLLARLFACTRLSRYSRRRPWEQRKRKLSRAEKSKTMLSPVLLLQKDQRTQRDRR